MFCVCSLWRYFPPESDILTSKLGHLPVMKWLRHTYQLYPNNDVLQSAALGGHLNVLQWLCSTYSPTLKAGVFVSAADRGHLHILQWLQHSYQPIVKKTWLYTFVQASMNGHLSMIQWLHRIHPFNPLDARWSDNYAFRKAAGGGHLEVLSVGR